MKKSLGLFSVIIVLVFGIASSSNADILDFDDIFDGDLAIIPDGYGGFDWENLAVIHRDYFDGSGYDNGTVSGDYVAATINEISASVSDGVFTFNSVYLTSAWVDDLNITVTGLLGGSVVHETTVSVDTDAPTLFNFNFTGIDQLTFHSINEASGQNDYFNFAMDDYNFTGAPVPEPATMLLLGTGLIGMAGIGRKKLFK